MERMIRKYDGYSICEADTECVGEVANFIVRENYKHHQSKQSFDNMQLKEAASIKADEMKYKGSHFFLARDTKGKLIGAIRVFHWNGKDELPIEHIFQINPMETIGKGEDFSYWHVGRFAIDLSAGFSTLSMFKQLMALAIMPIVHDKHGYMIAETDCKLHRIMNKLGIATTSLGKPVYHLASMTEPICSSREDLLPYYVRMSNGIASSCLDTKV